MTWHPDEAPPRLHLSPAGWFLAGLRLLALAPVLFGGLALLALIRAVEGKGRLMSAGFVHLVARLCLAIIGLRLQRSGAPPIASGVMAGNHVSWLDIFTLNGAMPLTFVSKSEVSGWPLIGALARGTGTLFIRRDRAEAAEQVAQIRARLAAGGRLMLFAEGTSTDGRRVLPFKSALFGAVIGEGEGPLVQPVSLVYHAPEGADPRLYGWFGGMDFAPHFLGILGRWRQGRAEVILHPPLRPADYPSRKALAAAAEAAVRQGFDTALSRHS